MNHNGEAGASWVSDAAKKLEQYAAVHDAAAPSDTRALCMLVAEAAHRNATGGKAMPSDQIRAIVDEVLAGAAAKSEQAATCTGCDPAEGFCRTCREKEQRELDAAPSAEQADWINDVVRDVAELPDRDSPADQPEMMLVTADELRDIIAQHVPSAGAASKSEQVPADKAIYWFSVLSKCARLLEVPDDEPIPPGVLRAVESLIAAQMATAAGAGSAQPRAEGDERADFEPFTLAELDEMETVARAAPATWYGTYQIIDGISDEKAVELIEACSPYSIITLVRQARAALARAPLPAQGDSVDKVASAHKAIQFALELAEHENDDAAISFLTAWSTEDHGYLQSNWPDFDRSGAAGAAEQAQPVDDARDAARLDFLGGPAIVSMHQYEPADAEPYIAIDLDLLGSPAVRGSTIREAIDAAMRANDSAAEGERP